MSDIVLISGLVVLWCCWLYKRHQRLWKHIEKFPGPATIPILGNALQMGRKPEEYVLNLCRLCKEFNFEPFRLYCGPQPYIFFSDTKHIEALLSSSKLIYKADMYEYFRPWFGDGLVTSSGRKWSQHRKLITPFFHFQILQEHLAIMNETMDRFVTFLNTFADRGEIFDFQEIVAQSAFEIVTECTLGTRIETIDCESNKLLDCVTGACEIIIGRIFNPFKRLDFMFRLTGDYQKQLKIKKIEQKDFTKIIDERRAYFESRKNNIESEFVQNGNQGSGKRRRLTVLDNILAAELDGRPFTFQEIFDELKTIILAGYDTTATTLAFAAYCLSRHPEVQQLAYEEQLSIFGTDTTRNPNSQDIQHMKYLELVIKETLRIYPSVPVIGRTMAEDTQINDFIIPKNVTVIVSILSLSTNEKNFEDPFVFRPERFEKTAGNAANAFAYVPFSAGPRNCIGQKFAMMELKVTLSKLLRHFHILPPVDGLSKGIYDHGDPTANPRGPYDPQLALLVTLKSINGIPLRLQKR